jgi:ADP-ribose pyrophosphatase
MDPDESPETCAIRELKEETGYIGELVSDKTVCKLFFYRRNLG